jgi:hypothetical protein
MVDEKLQMPNSWMEMLDNLGIDDPRLRLMVEMMGKQSTATSPQPSLEEKLEKKKRALARIEMLRRENEELREENQLLRERLDLLATALGACPECWGEEQACASCQGRGIPGSFKPDRDGFVAYVLPAIRTAQRFSQRTRDRGEKKTGDGRRETGGKTELLLQEKKPVDQ